MDHKKLNKNILKNSCCEKEKVPPEEEVVFWRELSHGSKNLSDNFIGQNRSLDKDGLMVGRTTL